MNNYLKKSVERFDKLRGEEEFLINPISEIDGEIITEIYELFKKFGHDEIVAILSKYKYRKDEEIRDMLLDYNTNFNEKESEDEGGKKQNVDIQRLRQEIYDQIIESLKRKAIKLNGKLISLHYIHGFSTDEIIDEGKVTYSIILNKTSDIYDSVSSKNPYSNYNIDYKSQGKRDRDVERLEIALQDESNFEII